MKTDISKVKDEILIGNKFEKSSTTFYPVVHHLKV